METLRASRKSNSSQAMKSNKLLVPVTIPVVQSVTIFEISAQTNFMNFFREIWAGKRKKGSKVN
jgi:hypothetical protein